MNVSLNEVEATAKRAARGAGYPWGLAEEAAKATRFLCAHDIDGCAALAALLTNIDNTDLAHHAPKIEGNGWRATSGSLCPLFAGAAISDHAELLRRHEIRFHNVISPTLLIPFAAMAAIELETPVSIEWGSALSVTDGNKVSMFGDLSDLADLLTLRLAGELDQPNTSKTRATPLAASWTSLNNFAYRTYAPASEESRAKGAGAGLTDND